MTTNDHGAMPSYEWCVQGNKHIGWRVTRFLLPHYVEAETQYRGFNEQEARTVANALNSQRA